MKKRLCNFRSLTDLVTRVLCFESSQILSKNATIRNSMVASTTGTLKLKSLLLNSGVFLRRQETGRFVISTTSVVPKATQSDVDLSAGTWNALFLKVSCLGSDSNGITEENVSEEKSTSSCWSLLLYWFPAKHSRSTSWNLEAEKFCRYCIQIRHIFKAVYQEAARCIIGLIHYVF
jgi:hypothetical protein